MQCATWRPAVAATVTLQGRWQLMLSHNQSKPRALVIVWKAVEEVICLPVRRPRHLHRKGYSLHLEELHRGGENAG